MKLALIRTTNVLIFIGIVLNIIIPAVLANGCCTECEANKKIVQDFYQEFFGDKDVGAADKYIDENEYIQHNPLVADGREALKKAFSTWFKGAPKERIDFIHTGADGDLVWVHTKATIVGKINTVIDIFRLNNNKIVEHWDAIQPMPEGSKNPHPLF